MNIKRLISNNNFLLICGIASTILYIGGDAVTAMAYPGYSYRDQTISELSAVGSPTKIIWTIFAFIINPLIIAFGLGVRRVAQIRSLQIAGTLLIVWGVLGFVWLIFPMNVRGEIGSFTDTMHLVMTGITVLLITAFIGFGSRGQGKAFSIYSWLTILVMFSFGILVALQAPQVVAQLPTPWMGVFERITVFSPMVWVSVLAIILLRRV